MALRYYVLSLLKSFVSLWLTISLVFFLSRLLPVVNVPKGLGEEEIASYGGINAETIASVTAEYKRRTGLDLPLFYVGFSPAYQEELLGMTINAQDRFWVQKAITWKDPTHVRAFYTSLVEWREQKPSAVVDEERHRLIVWATSEHLLKRQQAENSLLAYFQAHTDFHTKALLKEWQLLQVSNSSFKSHLPVLQWHGPQNAYHLWLTQLLNGNLGSSRQDYQLVTNKISDAAHLSFSLALLGLLVGIVASYAGGIYLTLKPASVFSQLLSFLLYLLDSIPGFIIALVLFAFTLVWTANVSSNIMADNLQELPIFLLWTQPAILMGSICISLLILPHLTLQFSRSLAEQTSKLYYRTALAKGLTPKEALTIHAVPNALLPTLTLLSEMVIGLMSGVLIVEITFSLPGLGSLLTNSILTGDYYVLIGLTLFFLLLRAFVVWVTENALLFLDPRMRNGNA